MGSSEKKRQMLNYAKCLLLKIENSDLHTWP